MKSDDITNLGGDIQSTIKLTSANDPSQEAAELSLSLSSPSHPLEHRQRRLPPYHISPNYHICIQSSRGEEPHPNPHVTPYSAPQILRRGSIERLSIFIHMPGSFLSSLIHLNNSCLEEDSKGLTDEEEHGALPYI